MKIVFATNNQHKLSEVRQILGDQIEVLSLNDIGCHEDIPETGTTLEANALQKAHYIYDNYHYDCSSDCCCINNYEHNFDNDNNDSRC